MERKTDPKTPWRVAVVLALFGLTWLLLQSTAMVTSIPIKQPLKTFPDRIGSYRLLSSHQSSAEVVELLGVDDYIHFTYTTPTGNRISLYVAFYESVGVDGGYHSPKNCLPGGGWGIDSVKPVSIGGGIDGEPKLTVARMLIRNGSNYQVVLYWFQNRGRIIASEYWEKIYLVWDAIFKKRRDGSFIRIMINVTDGDIEAAEQEAKQFAGQVVAQLKRYLPGAADAR